MDQFLWSTLSHTCSDKFSGQFCVLERVYLYSHFEAVLEMVRFNTLTRLPFATGACSSSPISLLEFLHTWAHWSWIRIHCFLLGHLGSWLVLSICVCTHCWRQDIDDAVEDWMEVLNSTSLYILKIVIIQYIVLCIKLVGSRIFVLNSGWNMNGSVL